MRTIPLWLSLTAIIIALLVIISGFALYRAQETAQISEVSASLMSIGKLKTEQIAGWREEIIADAQLMMDSLSYSGEIKRWVTQPTEIHSRDVHSWFVTFLNHNKFSNILISDPDGTILFNLAGRQFIVSDETKRAFVLAAKMHKPVMSDLQPEPISNKPYIVTAVPLYTGETDDIRPARMLLLVTDPETTLYPLIMKWPVLSASGETLLVEKNGQDALFLNELRFRKNTALQLRISLNRTDVPAVSAILGKEGIFRGIDYRGVKVFSALLSIPGTPWKIVAKLDESECLASWHFRSTLIIIVICLTLAIGLGSALIIWMRLSRTYYKKMFQAESIYRTTLMSVGDGVISTDVSGNIELMNPAAEHMTGWKLNEAKGLRLETVFRILNEFSRQEVENPVRRVVREGIVVGLANHTVLRSKDDIERPILDSGAPIKDQKGTTTGVVLVFRDQSEEREIARRLTESENKYRTLFSSINDGFALHELVYEGDKAVNYRIIDVNMKYREILNMKEADLIGITATEVYGTQEPPYLDVYMKVAETGEPTSFETYFPPMDKYFQISVFSPDKGKFATLFQDISIRRKSEEERERLINQLHQAQKMESVGRLAGGVAHDFNNKLQMILGYADIALGDIAEGDAARESILEMKLAAQRSADLTRQLLAFARKQTVSPRILDLNETIAGMLKMLRRLIGEDITLDWKPCDGIWPVRVDPSQIDQILANLAVNARDAISGVGELTIETANVVFDREYCLEHPEYVPGEYVALLVSDDGHGIDKEILPHIFEPFYTTKETGKGTGLGLATVYGIVKQNDGFITVYSEQHHGTTFKVYFRRSSENEIPPIPVGELKPPQKGSETVLIVEDEVSILNLGKTFLERLGYSVLTAGSPSEAMDIAQTLNKPLDVLITDVIMPEMNGRELENRIRAVHPGLKCLYMSGYTANIIAHQGIVDKDVNFLPKPFSFLELASKVREILKGG